MAGTYDSTLDLLAAATYTADFITNFGGGTVGGARDAIIQHLIAGETYFNIHTETVPGWRDPRPIDACARTRVAGTARHCTG